MPKYLCKWSSGIGKYLEWEELMNVNEDFFSEENGYDLESRFMVGKLKKGDSIDLSDGISQYHEVERLS